MSALGLFLVFSLLRLQPLVPPWQAVLVLPDGQALRGQAAHTLDPAGLSGVDHLWHWSATAAPERVHAAAWSGEPPRETRERLRVRVAGASAEKPLRGFAVVAAPRPMWLEVPEGLLPRWPLSPLGEAEIPRRPGEPWRVRLVGPGEGGWWAEVEPQAREVLLTRHAAASISISLVGAAGKAAPAAVLQVLEPVRPEEGGLRKTAVLAPGADGRVLIPSLPSLASATWLAGDPESLPWWFEGRAEDLPGVIELTAGATLSGRFRDSRGRPVAQVEVRLETWLAPSVPVPLVRATQTDDHGSWSFRGLPVGRLAIHAHREGFAAYRGQITLQGETLDLGELTLERAEGVAFRVSDELGEPVPGARVRVEGGAVAATDEGGLAIARDAPGQRAFSYTVEAPDHLPARGSADAQSAVPVTVELQRAFLLTGRFVGRRGQPVPGGALSVSTGNQSVLEPLASDGGFRLTLAPGQEVAVTLRSPRTLPLNLTVPAGLAGEIRDLGDLVGPAGASVTGRLVRRGGGEAVAGGRVWLPRPGPRGPALAWLHQDLVEAASDADGFFRVEGLSPGIGGLLRIDAPGFARAHLAMPPLAEEEARDLGEVVLDEGSILDVLLGEDPGELAPEDAAIARLDLRGEALEQDSLRAPFDAGRATFRQVPAGSAWLEVESGETILCRLEVEVPAAGGHATVECRARPMRVEGVVEVGDELASGGVLIWQPPAEAYPMGIIRYRMPSGLTSTRLSGGSRPQPQVDVAADGTFVTSKLYPGSWEVWYYPQPGEPASSRRVELPRRPSYWLALTYPASTLRGRVEDEAGEPVADARVQELEAGLTTFSRADGSFVFHGIGPGHYVFEAHATVAGRGELRSDLLPLAVEPGQPPEDLRLIVRSAAQPTLTIEVAGPEGQAAAAQLVFVELEGRGLQVLTSDAAGLARATLPRPLPARVRAAALSAGSWALGEWVSVAEALETGLRLAPTAQGQLLLRTSHAAGAPQILAPQGWDLTRLLTWLGLRPWVSPDRPLTLPGLPSGRYGVSLGQAAASTVVEAAEPSEVWLDRPW